MPRLNISNCFAAYEAVPSKHDIYVMPYDSGKSAGSITCCITCCSGTHTAVGSNAIAAANSMTRDLLHKSAGIFLTALRYIRAKTYCGIQLLYDISSLV